MNKLFFIFIFLLFASELPAQERKYSDNSNFQSSKELPLELNLMIESIDNAILEKSTSLSRNAFIDSILYIDTYARVLNKEDIFLIGKIEIYKTLLKLNSSNPRAAIDGSSLNALKEAIKKTTDPFSLWFLQALLKDSDGLIGTTLFKEYVLQKNMGKFERSELKKIDKKVQLIYRWVSKMNPGAEDFQNIFKAELMPLMIDSLENIKQSVYLMASNTSFEPLPKLLTSTEELKYFAFKEAKKKVEKIEKREKSVDDILSPITDEAKSILPNLPQPSNENWLNDENSPSSLKNLPKPGDNADWLEDF